MCNIKSHINSLLLIAGFMLMAGGGAELANAGGGKDPEPAGQVDTPQVLADGSPEGAFALYPEQNIIPAFGPFPLLDSAPEQPRVGALDPDRATALDPDRAEALDPQLAAAEEPEELEPDYTGTLERFATGNMLRFIEGPFGALVMVGSGLGAILAGAFGAYKAAISLLFVAVGAFILRALVSLFFGGGYDAYSTTAEFVGQGGVGP